MSDSNPIRQLTPSAIFGKLVTPTCWFEFKEGIKFKLAFVPKAKFREISDESMEWVFDERTKTRVQRINSKVFQSKFLRVAVQGWENVTLRTMSSIAEIDISGCTAEELDAPIPFSHEWMVKLEEVAYDLDQFISQQVSDIRLFRPELESELKNSRSTQSTT